MNRLEKYQREAAENLADKKAELYHEHLESEKEKKYRVKALNSLRAYMGLDEFNKLSKDNLNMIVGAMQEYAENCKL
jgi:hypothetical protein